MIQDNIVQDISKYGWSVIQVYEDEIGPGFGYSIGFFETYKHPEIIIVGLKIDLILDLINNIGDDIKSGIVFEENKFYNDIIKNFECYITQVISEHYESYVGQALEYYNEKNFPLLQCIYPTVKNIYPWQEEWPANLKDKQPILGDLKNFYNQKFFGHRTPDNGQRFDLLPTAVRSPFDRSVI